jgi:hypothetical protein
MTSTRMTSSSAPAPLAGTDAAAEVDGRRAAVFERSGFLAVLAARRLHSPARRALLERLPLVEVDVTAILLERLSEHRLSVAGRAGGRHRGCGRREFPGAGGPGAPRGDPGGPADAGDRRAGAAHRGGALARYGQLEVLRELTDFSRPRPAARLLLVPARQPAPAKLDREPLPLTSPASQSLWLPEPWISAQPAGRTPTR